MCVGGAPIRSPDHADHIATMALDLLHESGKFRIRHLPYTALRVRIGLHTGINPVQKALDAFLTRRLSQNL